MKNTWYTGRGHRDSFFECLNYLSEPKIWCHLQLLSLQRDRKRKTTKTALTPSQVQRHARVSIAMSLPRSRRWESTLGGPLDIVFHEQHTTSPSPAIWSPIWISNLSTLLQIPATIKFKQRSSLAWTTANGLSTHLPTSFCFVRPRDLQDLALEMAVFTSLSGQHDCSSAMDLQ